MCWLETAFQPSTISSIRRFKKTSYVQTPLFAFETKLGRAPNSKQGFPQRWPRRYATLSECRNATTFCHSQHANASFSKELGTLINSSFYSLLTLGDFAISSPQQKLDIAGGCTATSPYITSKKLRSKGRLHRRVQELGLGLLRIRLC